MSAFDALRVSLDGTHLIEADAGTGKTHAIVSLYLRLLLERNLSVGEILVVTYTVAAAAELRDRIRSRLVALGQGLRAAALGQAFEDAADVDLVRARLARGSAAEDAGRIEAAARNFDCAAVFTIHGFCQRVLGEHAFESGTSFESELLTDQRALLEEVAQDFWARELYAAPDLLARHVFAARVTPTSLAELAGRICARPDMRVVPMRPDIPDLDSRQHAWKQAFAPVRTMWVARGHEVIDQLAHAPGLHQVKYRGVTNGTWRRDMDAALATGRPGILRAFPRFYRFTTAGLEEGTKVGSAPPTDRFFPLCDALAGAEDRLTRALDARLLALRLDFVDYARRELSRRKRERDALFFDDLLQRLADALVGDGGDELAASIRRRYPAALIDEFQDTDPVQYRIFRRVWHGAAGGEGGASLFLIGDPKQAIYGFRGADVFAYLRARRDAAEQVHTLSRNWRADPALVAALNALFGRSEDPFVLEGIPFQPALVGHTRPNALSSGRIRSGLRVLFVPRGVDAGSKKLRKAWGDGPLLEAVAAEVSRLLSGDVTINGKSLEPADIAILCRTNKQGRGIQAGLRTLGIAGVLQSDESVFAAPEAEELERVMRAMAEPEVPAHLRAALATSLLGSSARDLLALDDGEEGWERLATCFRSSRQIWVESGFLQALRAVLAFHAVQPRLLANIDGERRLTNLLHLGELLHRAATEARLGPLSLLYWLGRRRREALSGSEAVAEAAELRLESDARAVQLVTVHRSKGLQYPVTCVPFAWDGRLLRGADERLLRFHDPSSGDLSLDLGSTDHAEHVALARREALAESLRLFYVGLTRAEHHCSIVWGAFSDAGTSPIGMLLHPPESIGPGVGPRDGFPALGDEKRLDALDEPELRAALEALATASHGTVTVEDIDLSPAVATEGGSADRAASALTHRRASREVFVGHRTSSFSGLVAGARKSVQTSGALAAEPLRRIDPAALEGRDYDAGSDEREPVDATRPRAEAEAPVRLAEFPAGVGPGILLHEIFEELDFAVADDAALATLVAEGLARHGISRRWGAVLVRAIRDVLDVPLDRERPGLALSRVSRGDRMDEMQFVFPVRRGAGEARLRAEDLAAVFRTHAQAPAVRQYAERAARLSFAPLAGYLRGFIDLAFRWRGEPGARGHWFVVDYKSNHLGAALADYGPTQLDDAMIRHDYILQYHLYLVALHRYLSSRLPGYDYDRDIGGAYYLFLRGMSAGDPADRAASGRDGVSPGHGVFRDRPPRALIESLSSLLAAAGKLPAAAPSEASTQRLVQ